MAADSARAAVSFGANWPPLRPTLIPVVKYIFTLQTSPTVDVLKIKKLHFSGAFYGAPVLHHDGGYSQQLSHMFVNQTAAGMYL